MPNWVEGKLKIRGKPEDIKRWVEGFSPTGAARRGGSIL